MPDDATPPPVTPPEPLDQADQADPHVSLRKTTRLTLARKLATIGGIFLILALLTVGMSMWVTWQLEGGAAAINEAGRMRMRSYQMALHLRDLDGGSTTQGVEQVAERLAELDASLSLLIKGDPQRPLTVPGSPEVRERLTEVEAGWRQLRAQTVQQIQQPQRPHGDAGVKVDAFVAQVDALVSAIERRLEARTVALHTFQLVMMLLAVVSALVLLYAAHVVVLEPVARLRAALARVENADFSARVRPSAEDELGELAEGFNRMTQQLAMSYGNLEAKVTEKTQKLQHEQARLQALYDVSTFVASADDLRSLAEGFARKMRGIAHSDAVAIRWSDEANERYMLLASDSLPHVLAEDEQCVLTGDCLCGARVPPEGLPRMRVIPILEAPESAAPPGSAGKNVKRRCEQEGYTTLVTLPLNLQHRLLGEIELFYRNDVTFSEAERNLFEALASHLAGAMESLRMAALDRESAVASERKLLAQELHDSIAQSLAFLKIQMGLLRTAMARGDQAAIDSAMSELDLGVKESYSDVRELLLHFRVRTDSGHLDMALRETLSKFELQTGLTTHLAYADDGVPLPADVQIQVLHIVQEALSNVRKHAHAKAVWVDVQAHPRWRIRVRDNGRGFDPSGKGLDATHVGLSIMKERAARIHAAIAVQSGPQGTEIELALPGTVTATPALTPAA
ncbi:MAG: type IV pili methyl-accepting chemotaxis transducer N-terminal domain-containing protein [Aquabacterium sp.]